MPETTENTKRWNGYVCPECRFVFRVPRSHDGSGVVCPGCHRMLRIPRAGEVSPAPVIDPATAGAEAEDDNPEETKRVKHRRSSHSRDAEVPDWERHPGGHGGSETTRIGLWIGAAVFGLVVIGGVMVVLFSNSKPQSVPSTVSADGTLAPEPDVVVPEVMRKSETAVLAEAEPVVRAFLEARTVDELLPLVRNPGRAEPRIRRSHPDGQIDPPGMSAFNLTGTVAFRDGLASLIVRTRDHEVRQVAFEDGPDGVKVDWESWAGWSDMPWEEFITTRPAGPQVFRVLLRQVEYYNFDFTDDREWQSYALTSPDGEHVLYGYAPRESVLNQRLKPAEVSTVSSVMVAIRHPETETPRNQVLITDMISDGWVEDDTQDKP